MEFTIELALVDYIPVIFFAIGAVILMTDLRGKMSLFNFIIFALGMSAVTIAGATKATWKLLYAAKIGDFVFMNKMFLPAQSIGFLLAGIGILMMLFFKKHSGTRLLSISPFAFIGMMVAGLGILDTVLCIVAAKLKKPGIIAIFVFSFVCSLCMGYLSSQDFTEALWNWIGEGVNVLGQGSFLVGTIALHKSGLRELEF